VLLGTDGSGGREGVLDVAGLAALGDRHPGLADAAAVTPDSPGDILYTSGTTGLPKGVVVTHDAVLRTSYGSALTRAYQDGRRILFSLPCYHMFGYVEGLLSVMFAGGGFGLVCASDLVVAGESAGSWPGRPGSGWHRTRACR
jgi:fatty-acyl-CoA synthase